MKSAARPFSDEYAPQVMGIFNYYIENSFAAFPEQPLPVEAFGMMKNMSKDLPARVLVDEDDGGRCIGFGFLKAYNPMPAFRKTAAITCFIDRDCTGKGLGRNLLSILEAEAREKGITSILAEISSENPGSLRFHGANGFRECGRFAGIGMKKGKTFDVIWMQKILAG
ncbi:MAG: N-acetyltransferase [Spirochaetes bacterium]|nr:N-acetyltransferase [Spirochaetota bacterium]